ncbi:50S ribosomal protein L9 [Candidatus Kuenenbacteria bacterium HGW-Kuenenbacteria-1]|uniref:Large ribosomal subunit protein bL9 n=1 Tax=Candidatus Kuenenbacteria bacterium HGW-Kuenenbacteria-1 TaxID=2013812 RepID=A0A2N1UMM0_9BACT|nr:MAG: 50S ribosomal protein L9 [Candidatus Kuenenbacteria bacterium HGW-Kuenenbacteria-1]
MKILLLQDIKNLGKKGDIKEVANGYATNFLFPQKIATIATAIEIKKIEIKIQKQEKNQEKEIQKAKELKKKIQEIEIEIKAKANEKGVLFASLEKEEIAKVLSKKINQEIKSNQIILEKPIKEIGKYKVNVKLCENVEADVVVQVKEE